MIWVEKRCNVTAEDLNGMNCLTQDVVRIDLQLRFSVSTLPGNLDEKVKEYLCSLFPMLKALLLTGVAEKKKLLLIREHPGKDGVVLASF